MTFIEMFYYRCSRTTYQLFRLSAVMSVPLQCILIMCCS